MPAVQVGDFGAFLRPVLKVNDGRVDLRRREEDSRRNDAHDSDVRLALAPEGKCTVVLRVRFRHHALADLFLDQDRHGSRRIRKREQVRHDGGRDTVRQIRHEFQIRVGILCPQRVDLFHDDRIQAVFVLENVLIQHRDVFAREKLLAGELEKLWIQFHRNDVTRQRRHLHSQPTRTGPDFQNDVRRLNVCAAYHQLQKILVHEEILPQFVLR